jgi:hypothetical protein
MTQLDSESRTRPLRFFGRAVVSGHCRGFAASRSHQVVLIDEYVNQPGYFFRKAPGKDIGKLIGSSILSWKELSPTKISLHKQRDQVRKDTLWIHHAFLRMQNVVFP